MPFSDTSYNLRIELDTHNCDFSAEAIENMEAGLEPLRKPVEKFPVSDLYITITFHSRSNSHRVKTALVLSGRTLTTSDVDDDAYTAFKRCIRKLVRKLETYEASLERSAERSKHLKGTYQAMIPDVEPDADRLRAAVDRQDYRAFRDSMAMYEELLRQRIGRWVQRYPDVERRIGDDLELADMVDEVLLNAFERWDERPSGVPLGAWLEHLIEPSIQLLAEHPTEELENIQFSRSWREG